jgi:hypothetical protein
MAKSGSNGGKKAPPGDKTGKTEKANTQGPDEAALAWEAIPKALKEAGQRAADLAQNPYARGLLAAGLVTAACCAGCQQECPRSHPPQRQGRDRGRQRSRRGRGRECQQDRGGHHQRGHRSRAADAEPERRHGGARLGSGAGRGGRAGAACRTASRPSSRRAERQPLLRRRTAQEGAGRWQGAAAKPQIGTRAPGRASAGKAGARSQARASKPRRKQGS